MWEPESVPCDEWRRPTFWYEWGSLEWMWNEWDVSLPSTCVQNIVLVWNRCHESGPMNFNPSDHMLLGFKLNKGQYGHQNTDVCILEKLIPNMLWSEKVEFYWSWLWTPTWNWKHVLDICALVMHRQSWELGLLTTGADQHQGETLAGDSEGPPAGQATCLGSHWHRQRAPVSWTGGEMKVVN